MIAEQGKTYSTFIESELKAERDRRTSLDAKGLNVVTTSASLTTLLVTIGAFVTGRGAVVIPHESILPIIGTLAAFVLAAILGVFASAGRLYQISTPRTLAEMLGGHWRDNEVDARNNVSVLNVKTIDSLRQGNNCKVQLILAAVVIQVVGLVVLSYAVWTILEAHA